jgi:DNA invertase Pin-like site-specific DNA recombinase
MSIIGYYRVSTSKQGESGLGLEAQQAAVEAFAKANNGIIVKTYREVESGKRSDRPELTKAIAHAKRCKGKLVVAKLDRLARNVAFTSALMESKVDFTACDNPHANRLTVHILAAVAEAEAEAISSRTKAALNAYKARGGLLGSARPECRHNLNAEAMAKGQQLAAKARTDKANEAYADLYPLLTQLRQEGRTLRQIAEALNTEGYTTRRGRPWNHVQVKLVLERAARQ